MRIVIFTHSLVSDWNHGNAHFLRGIASELLARGHDVRILEPLDGWSRQNLAQRYPGAIADFQKAYPRLTSAIYDPDSLDLNQALAGVAIVIVHEWNSHSLVARIGQHRALRGDYRLFFHDTHHRSVTEPHVMADHNLHHYDGVLAYGNVIRDLYRSRGWAREAWTWHEAADTRVFYPRSSVAKEGDVVWIGNWGDDERADELREFFIKPVKQLGIRPRVYGVRYPQSALRELADAHIEYGGWVANFHVPEVFAKFRVTVHVPRRPYSHALPGIPTIRPFGALSCGIPLVSAPWQDSESLFRAVRDFLTAGNGDEVQSHLANLLAPDEACRLAASGLETIRARHTCAHHVDELLALAQQPTKELTSQAEI